MITIITDCSLPKKLIERLESSFGEVSIKNVGYNFSSINDFDKYEKVIFAVSTNEEVGILQEFSNGNKYICSMPMSKLTSVDYELITIFIRHCAILSGKVPQIKLKIPKNVYVDSIKKFDKAMSIIENTDITAWDTETYNLNMVDNRFISIQVAVSDSLTFFIPYAHPKTPFTSKELLYIKKRFKEYLEKGKSKYHIYQNADFDIARFYSFFGVRFYNHEVFDTMAGLYAIDENRKHYYKYKKGAYTLKTLCEEYGMKDLYSTGNIGKEDRANMANSELKDIAEYGWKDVASIYAIADAMIKENGEEFKKYVIYQLGRNSRLIARMEANGIFIDKKLCASLNSENGLFAEAKKHLQQELINLPSVKNVLKKQTNKGFFGNQTFDIFKKDNQRALFQDELKLQVSLSDKGNPQFGEEFKQKYKDDYPEVKIFNELGENIKLSSTYVKGMYDKLGEPDTKIDGRIHASYDYKKVITGRLCSFNPNFQNLPKHGDMNILNKILGQFSCEKGKVIIKADYSAHEVRMWGNIARDQAVANSFYIGTEMTRKYRIEDSKGLDVEKEVEIAETEGDVHKQNYKRFYGRLPKDKEERQSVKAVVFGALYGKGITSLAVDLKEKPVMTREEAVQRIKNGEI